MRKLFALAVLAFAALMAAPATAADFPVYPPIIEIPPIPPVDYGVDGSFYLRGSAGFNISGAASAEFLCCDYEIDNGGHGYSIGAGFGYETGTGLRADVTLDYFTNSGLSADIYSLEMRSTLGMANVYYDFGFGGHGYSAEGGLVGYVGAGIGLSYNQFDVSGACGCDGDGVEGAVAGMVGLGYDMGAIVADLGYRAIYMPELSPHNEVPFYVNDAMIHEVRGTVRYRFN